MKFLILLFLPTMALAKVSSEAFLIRISDRNISVISPQAKKKMFAVVVENKSLSDQLGKFLIEGKNVKYISVKSGDSETVEIENTSSSNPVFVPVSPAFQEVELIFGKKAYEVPSKE